MKNSINGNALRPSGIIDRDVAKSNLFQKVNDWIKVNVFEGHNIFKEKDLLFVTSMSLIWFIAFFYCLLYVFT